MSNINERLNCIERPIMKAYVLGISFLTAVFLGSFTVPTQEEPFQAQTGEEINPSQKAFMEAQVAHLHHLHPIDIKQVPAIYPLAETEHVHKTSPFGMRSHPVFKVLKMHQGQDFSAPPGTPVIATADGRIKEATSIIDKSGYGKHIVIEHEEVFQNESYATLYAHLSRITVKPGEIVARGDTIGFTGNTGTSTNPHLHYEVIKNGKRVNPSDYLM